MLAWHARHGRHDLPWQQPRTPYRVWLSEVMLQQTTVAAVIPYFHRFVARFPDLASLAAADLDQVLGLWQGLGYYARARNLHACARRVQAEHGGELPASREQLQALPGIGRSTAAAICAQAYGQREAILDANVRRLLARHSGEREWPGASAAQKRLWAQAEARLPDRALPDYTQGVMDLGAQVCKPRQPDCPACPVREDCAALAQSLTASIPAPAPKKSRPRPQRQCRMWVHRRADGAIWLQRRPEQGLWGGLWSLPQSPPRDVSPPGDVPQPGEVGAAASTPAEAAPEATADQGAPLPLLRHGFTHFDLEIQPWLVEDAPPDAVAEPAAVYAQAGGRWVAPTELGEYGLPTAVRKILATLPA